MKLYNFLNHKNKGFSIIEILIAMGVLAIAVSSVGIFAAVSSRTVSLSDKQVDASLHVQEYLNALRIMKQDSWREITDATGGGDKSIVFANNRYSIVNGETTYDDDITIGMTVAYAYRDASGNIVSSGGTLDLHTRQVVVTANWTAYNQSRFVDSTVYFSDWNLATLTQTTSTDFNSGTKTNVEVTNLSGGEVRLQSYSWCTPTNGFSLLPRAMPSGVTGVSTITIGDNNNAYLGYTSSGTSNTTLQRYSITDATAPAFPSIALATGITATSVRQTAKSGNYLYVAKSSTGSSGVNSYEMLILDATTLAQVGYYQLSGTNSAIGVKVSGNYAYLLFANNTIRVIDVTTKTGSRPEVDNITLAANGTNIEIVGNNLFVGIAGAGIELQIINIANPANIFVIGTADVSASTVNTIGVSANGNRVIIGGPSYAGGAEIYIVDTTLKTGARPTLGTYELGNGNVRDVVLQDNYMILINTSATGINNYEVVDISNVAAPTRCGQIASNSIGNVNLVSAEPWTSPSGVRYIILANQNTSNAIAIIRGPGVSGSSYASSGDFTSSITDTGTTSSEVYYVDIDATVPINTTLRLQYKIGNTSNLSGAIWQGPGGTAATYYNLVNGTNRIELPASTLARYVSYKAFFTTSNSTVTPVVNSVSFVFQK